MNFQGSEIAPSHRKKYLLEVHFLNSWTKCKLFVSADWVERILHPWEGNLPLNSFSPSIEGGIYMALSLSKLKDPIHTLNCWGIYSFSCRCSLSYIGQTKRRLCFRLNEHKLNIWNQETNKSVIAKHCWVNDPTFNFHSAKIVCKPNSVFELDFLEAYHIHNNINNVVVGLGKNNHRLIAK